MSEMFLGILNFSVIAFHPIKCLYYKFTTVHVAGEFVTGQEYTGWLVYAHFTVTFILIVF
jgi:hypothetical protein